MQTLSLLLMSFFFSTALYAVDVEAHPPIDLGYLPSDDLVYAEVKEDSTSFFYEVIVRRSDGLYEKGILRFQCRENADGVDVCIYLPRPYAFKSWYMSCNRSGACEDELTLRDVLPSKAPKTTSVKNLSL